MITVIRKLFPVGSTVIYIGRPTIFGNPFYMKSEAMRDEVVDKHRRHLREQYAMHKSVFNEINALVDRVRAGEHLALQCYCAPRRCHGDNIKELIEEILKEKK
jgi:hypothetical protein